jgi:hypothetical protein
LHSGPNVAVFAARRIVTAAGETLESRGNPRLFCLRRATSERFSGNIENKIRRGRGLLFVPNAGDGVLCPFRAPPPEGLVRIGAAGA